MKKKEDDRLANLFIGLFIGLIIGFIVGAAVVAIQAMRHELNRINKEIREYKDVIGQGKI